MPLASGTGLGPYEILGPIGAGGMGEVYKARDTRLDRTIAIKQSQEAFSERFEREARAVAALIMRISASFTTSSHAHSIRSAAIGSTRAARRAGT
jgi:serine/threonine protein kinase